MSWFFIALFAPALWSVTNHIDKYLIGKYFRGTGTGALIVFSSLIGLFVLPFILLFQVNVLDIKPLNALLVMGGSAVALLAILIYLYSLKKDEASIVVPLFQTIPVFSYVLAYIVLGETLTSRQMLGAVLVILGAISISFDLTEKKPKFKSVVFFLMLVSSFLRAYRDQFISVIKRSKVPIIGLNALNEIINVIASLCIKFASLLAPLALVWVVNGFQPFFVFIYGVILTLFFPKLGTESLLKKHL